MSEQTEFRRLQAARSFLSSGRYQDAYTACQQALVANQNDPDALYILGILALWSDQPKRALMFFRDAFAAGHPEASPHAQAARAFLAANAPDKALIRINHALSLNPDDWDTLHLIGGLLTSLDRHEQAAKVFARLISLAPEQPVPHMLLGSSLLYLGQAEAALASFRRACSIAPDYLAALAQLALSETQTTDQNCLNELIKAWETRNPTDIEGARQVGHAITKTYIDLGEADTACDWLGKAKSLVLEHVPPDTDKSKRAFSASRDLARSLNVSDEMSEDGPVFIVGLPRSGTTLTDRILTSHSKLTSAGERNEFLKGLMSAQGKFGEPNVTAEIIECARSVDLTGIGDQYLANISAIVENSGRFTDKLPVNAFLVPAILAAIPSARVICLRREPADCVFSIYRQFFPIRLEFYHYALRLDSLADHVCDFFDLVETFENCLPEGRFTVLDYEALVSDTESETRRLLDFCGLGFERQCLEFQNNSAAVSTASTTQVRQGIYTSSVGNWRGAEEKLAPALEILKARGRL